MPIRSVMSFAYRTRCSNPASAHSARARSTAVSGHNGSIARVKHTIFEAGCPSRSANAFRPRTRVLLSPPPEIPATIGVVIACSRRNCTMFSVTTSWNVAALRRCTIPSGWGCPCSHCPKMLASYRSFRLARGQDLLQVGGQGHRSHELLKPSPSHPVQTSARQGRDHHGEQLRHISLHRHHGGGLATNS